MKQNLSGGVIAVIIVVAVAVIGFFGYRYLSGGPNADVTQSRIDYYRQKAAQSAQAAKQGQMPATAPFPRGTQLPAAANSGR